MPDKSELIPGKIPRHIAIIMDGNGRWATERNLPRIMGHNAGVESVKEVVRTAREIGISVLTLYAFSTENWQRPAFEVQALMRLLKIYLINELVNMLQNNIRLCCLGQTERLSADVRKILARVIKKTAPNNELILNLALNYGAREEILLAAKRLAEKCARGELSPENISAELLAANLYTAGLPDPDLVIRTGGEARLSNFLLWQISYAEIYFTETKWPDFGRDNLIAAIHEYQRRERRFGKTGEQVQAK